jgi:hypothetical protein
MRVYGECKKCKREISYSTNAYTRVEFVMQDTENIPLTCKSCGFKKRFHVDELYAKKSKMAQFTAGLTFLIGTPLAIIYLVPILNGSKSNYVIYIAGGLLIIPGIVYGMINKQDQNRVNSFNRNKLKGRIHNI